MKTLFTFLLSIMILSSYGQQCAGLYNTAQPIIQAAPGLTPLPDQLPCIVAGQPVSDTLYFQNYGTFSGVPLSYTIIDSIENLPPGLCWTIDWPGNQVPGDSAAAVIVTGTTTAPPGQYRLHIMVTANLNGTVIGPVDIATVGGGTYYARVACTNGSCIPVDTTLGASNSYVAYTSSCTINTGGALTATITASASTTLCTDSTITLTANSGTGYTYLWSTGATTQSIMTNPSTSYDVTVYSGSDSAVSTPVTLNFVTCSNGNVPGFSGVGDATPCITSGVAVSDTILYYNLTSFLGLTIDSVHVRDLQNLPAGLTWSTNVPNNTFGSGAAGYFVIQGTTTAPAGQYKLVLEGDVHTQIANLDTVLLYQTFGSSFLYYLRVSCGNGACRAVDTTVGSANSFVPDTSCTPNGVFAVISPLGSTTICQGSSTTLTVNGGLYLAGFSYLWSTGDTTLAITATTTGTYTVTATLGGQTATASVIVSLTSSPYAYFTITADPTQAHTWDALNLCTGAGILQYNWNWGDSSNSSGATPSHTYDSAGYYTICVGVTDSNGCTNTYCDTNAYLFKTDNQMVQMNVIQFPLGISPVSATSTGISYYAGAVHFSQVLTATDVRMYDISGRMVMSQDKLTGAEMPVSDIADGVYIVSLQSSSYHVSQKLMIIR